MVEREQLRSRALPCTGCRETFPNIDALAEHFKVHDPDSRLSFLDPLAKLADEPDPDPAPAPRPPKYKPIPCPFGWCDRIPKTKAGHLVHVKWHRQHPGELPEPKYPSDAKAQVLWRLRRKRKRILEKLAETEGQIKGLESA